MLFRATAATLLTIARDPRHLGADVDFSVREGHGKVIDPLPGVCLGTMVCVSRTPPLRWFERPNTS